MGLVNLFIVFSSLFFPATTPYFSFGEGETQTCSKKFQDDPQINESGIHLTLHKVDGPCSPISLSRPLVDIVAHDEERIRALNSRLLKTTTPGSPDPRSKSVSIPVNPGLSISSSNYYINVGLGTPAKSYSMLIDTGSSLTWLQCQPCLSLCHGQAGPIFDPMASNTYKSVSCDAAECSDVKATTGHTPLCSKTNLCIFNATYADGSYSAGFLSRDTLTVAPSETLPDYIYGCGQDTRGIFGKEAGLIGLSRDKLSILTQLSSKYGYGFSYCLPANSTGTLSIGQSSNDTTAYKFTPMLTDPQDSSLYFLLLTGITVGGQLLSVPVEIYNTSTIIDSGTVITRLPLTVYTALRVAFVKAMSGYTSAPPFSILDTCFKTSSAGMSIPEVTMKFEGGADLKLGAKNILLDVKEDVTCLAFAGNKDDNEIVIIGNVQQETFKVAYDITNSRIGFAAGGCT